MWDYWVEETLSTGEKVIVPFDTEKEKEKYLEN